MSRKTVRLDARKQQENAIRALKLQLKSYNKLLDRREEFNKTFKGLGIKRIKSSTDFDDPKRVSIRELTAKLKTNNKRGQLELIKKIQEKYNEIDKGESYSDTFSEEEKQILQDALIDAADNFIERFKPGLEIEGFIIEERKVLDSFKKNWIIKASKDDQILTTYITILDDGSIWIRQEENYEQNVCKGFVKRIYDIWQDEVFDATLLAIEQLAEEEETESEEVSQVEYELS